MEYGHHQSEEARAKISAGLTGRPVSPETRAKLSATLMGHSVSPETRAKMSAMASNPSPETRAKQSAAHLNPSPETRAKISAAGKGRVASPETRAKLSAAKKGKPKSPEWCAKMSALQGKGALSFAYKGGPQASNGRHKAKRRLLCFVPLNLPFDSCEGHHIDKEFVVYIPAILHQGIKHNVWTGKNMDKINELAYEWLARENEA